jgi:NADH dehydrogenase
MAQASSNGNQRPRVVIIGAGFAGLRVIEGLRKAPVDILVIDRNNYHGFWPLLYQVATSILEPQQVVEPVRSIIRQARNARFVQATVEAIDREQHQVITDRGTFPYDELVIAAGSTSNFFGLEEIKEHGFELKDMPDAMALRNHMISCFEQAVLETDPECLDQWLTVVIVGGGPTGVELAGAIAELIRNDFRNDYPTIDFSKVRVVLVEAMDRVLLTFPPELSQKAQQALTDLGVELRFGTQVVGYKDQKLHFKDGTSMSARTVVWTAGVQANPLGKTLGVSLQRGGRVPITPELHLPEDPNVWVIGDMAYLEGKDGKPYPQLATTAMQQGRLVARNILHKLKGERLERYRYVDRGTMAIIGRHAAVARIWNVNWTGPIAWLIWLLVHLFYLISFRDRVMVLVNWIYNYFTQERGARAVVAPRRMTTAQLEAAVAEPSRADPTAATQT